MTLEHEQKPQNINNFLGTGLPYSPEYFKRAFDNMVEYQYSPQLFKDIIWAVDNNIPVTIGTTHQSYSDIEVMLELSRRTNEWREKPINFIYVYSAPAVKVNLDKLFDLRNEDYKKNHLIMIGIIRPSDETHPTYSLVINENMTQKVKDDASLYKELKNQGACVEIIPPEGTLKSGRFILGTNNIYGMCENNNNLYLLQAIRNKGLFIPNATNGLYKIFNPNDHKPSQEFIDAYKNISNKKIATTIFGQSIYLSSNEFLKLGDTQDKYRYLLIKIAELLPHEARGDYQKYFQ